MENNRENKTDKQFHDAFAEWEAAPSPKVWDKVEAALDEDKRRPGAWWWITGTLAILLCAAGAWYFWPKTNVPREYFTYNTAEMNMLSPINDSSLAMNYRAKETLPDSIKQVLKLMADSMTMAEAIKTGTPLTDNSANPNSAISKTSVSNPAPSPAPHTSSVTNNSKPSNPVVSTATNPVKKTNPVPTSSAIKKDTVKHTPTSTTSTKPVVTTTEKKNPAPEVSHNTTTVSSSPKPVSKPDSTKGKIKMDISMSAESSSKPANKEEQKNSQPLASANNNAKKDTIAKAKSEIVIKKTADSLVQVATLAWKRDSLQAAKADSIKKDSVAQVVKKDSVSKAQKALAAQDSAKKTAGFDAFSIALFFAPEVSRNDVTTTKPNFHLNGVMPDNHYMFGLKFSKALSNKIEINAGVAYSIYSQEINPDTVSFPKTISQPFVFNTSLGDMSVPAATMIQGYAPPPWITRIGYHYQYSEVVQFINVPLNVRYNMGSGKLKPFAEAGANLEIAFGEKATLDLMKENSGIVELTYGNLNTRTFNVAASAGIGLNYSISKHLGVFVEPQAMANLQSLSSSAKAHVYFFDCQGGLKLGF